MAIELRPYQDDAADGVREAFMRAVRSVLLALATGAGKTVVFSYIAKGASARGHKVLILAHRDALIKQASRKLTENGVQHGIIMARYTPRPSCNVQVASVQTMVRRIKKRAFDFDLIIIDEAHRSAARTYRDIIDAFPNACILGVTATPCRLDGKGLGTNAGGLYDELITGISIRDLIDQAYLVQPEVYAPGGDQLDFSGVDIVRGELDNGQVAAIVDRPVITGSAVEHYKELCNGVPAIAWCANIKHAENVEREFNAAGIPAMALHGDHDGDERDEAMRKLESGELKVVSFCQLLVEGVDCPAIGAIIILHRTLSLTSYLQVIGRGLRTHPNKTCCYILDHTGITWVHGLADEVREWTLDGVPKRKKRKKDEEDVGPVIDLVQCVKCGHTFKPKPKCPKCLTVVPPKPERRIEQVDGKLTKISPEMIEAARKKKHNEVIKARTLEELQRIGTERGYAPGWATRKWDFKQKARERHESNWKSRIETYAEYR